MLKVNTGAHTLLKTRLENEATASWGLIQPAVNLLTYRVLNEMEIYAAGKSVSAREHCLVNCGEVDKVVVKRLALQLPRARSTPACGEVGSERKVGFSCPAEVTCRVKKKGEEQQIIFQT